MTREENRSTKKQPSTELGTQEASQGNGPSVLPVVTLRTLEEAFNSICTHPSRFAPVRLTCKAAFVAKFFFDTHQLVVLGIAI